SLILPETPSDRAHVALSRVISRAQDIGVPPWELRMVTVSIGEDGWDTQKITEMFTGGPGGLQAAKAPAGNGERIVIVASENGADDLVRYLADAGLDQVETVTLTEGRDPGKIRANLVILQGDLDSVPDLIKRLVPSLPHPETPVLIKYTGTVQNKPLPKIPDFADYIPPGSSTGYLIHRVKNSLDLAHLRSDNEEVESFLKRLIRLLEEGDVDVQGHGQQVSNWAVVLGARLGLKGDDLEALRWGGLLHDVGKMFLPGRIVAKEGMLSAEEFTIVKSHPRLGYDLCKTFTMLENTLPIIKHHHERLDGKGYPEGLRGDNIPLLARIISVVDVYDTLIRRRPYRPAFPSEEAAQILRRESAEGMWDARITREFLGLVEG
ncbi:MAG: HD-GYP domain-containing protein, partial [Pseudomonadota bacterium]